MSDYFKNINEINYEGPDSENPLSFKYYDENKQVFRKNDERASSFLQLVIGTLLLGQD